MEICFDTPDERNCIIASSPIVPRVGENILLKGYDYSVVNVEYEFGPYLIPNPTLERVVIYLEKI